MPNILKTVLLLICSNIFMTYAWYGGPLRTMKDKPYLMVVICSWCIALLEYLLMVPANRIGSQSMSVAQLKIIQECISLSVFVPFVIVYMKEKWTWNFLYAGLCILGAIYFIFRDKF